MFTYHINHLEKKTAEEINKRNLLDERYHRNIAAAARELVAKGQGQLRYGGQYHSGTTLWLGEDDFSMIVEATWVS